MLRTLSEEQYRDVIRVLSMMPMLSIEVTTEVVDDEDQHVVTAGAIITVTIMLRHGTMESILSTTDAIEQPDQTAAEAAEDKEMDDSDNDIVELQAPTEEAKEEEEKKKTPVWRKPEKKKKNNAAKKGGKQKQKQKAKAGKPAEAGGDQPSEKV